MSGGDIQRSSLWKPTLVVAAILGALMAIPIAPVAAFLGFEAVSLRWFYARTPFVADLAGPTIADEKRQFSERTQRNFPRGTRTEFLRDLLISQGFIASSPYDGFESRLHVEHASFPCNIAWNVLWSAQDGRVSAVRGDMNATCL